MKSFLGPAALLLGGASLLRTAFGGIGTDVAQHLGEGLLRAAEENLARLHEWTGPARILIDVPANIRVTNDGEEKRHLASLRFDLRSFSKNSVSANLSCHL